MQAQEKTMKDIKSMLPEEIAADFAELGRAQIQGKAGVQVADPRRRIVR